MSATQDRGDDWLGGDPLDGPKREPMQWADRRGRHRCRMCRGEGRIPGVTKVRGKGSGMGSDYGPCPECGGSGWTSDDEDADDDSDDPHEADRIDDVL